MLCHCCFSAYFRICYQEVPRKEKEIVIDGTHQHSFCSDDDNLLGGTVNIVMNNTAQLDASKETGLLVNTETNVYGVCVVYRHRAAGEIFCIKMV
jgi:hypothetical protein